MASQPRQGRQKVAQGVSPGTPAAARKPRQGRKTRGVARVSYAPDGACTFLPPVPRAPALGYRLSPAFGGLASAFGGKVGALGNLASLAKGFNDIGLDGGMVAKFFPLVLSFVESRGGKDLRDMLAGVLGVGNQG